MFRLSLKRNKNEDQDNQLQLTNMVNLLELPHQNLEKKFNVKAKGLISLNKSNVLPLDQKFGDSSDINNSESNHRLLDSISVTIRHLSVGSSHLLLLDESYRVILLEKSGWRELEFFRDKFIRRVCCGIRHSMALSTDGNVWFWGEYLYHEDTITSIPETSPILLNSFSQNPIFFCNFAASWDYSFLVLTTGEIMSFGAGENGRLGHGNAESVFRPQIIESMSKILVKSVSCGWMHTLILTENGKIYSCGGNEHGQLGLSHFNKTYSPTEIINGISENGDETKKIIGISAGGTFSIVWSSTTVWSFGSNRHGQLGIGESLENSSTPLIIPTLSNNCSIITISSGCFHVLALDSSSKIWIWGKIDESGLSQITESIYVPMLFDLSIPRIPLSVVSGWKSCFVICSGMTLEYKQFATKHLIEVVLPISLTTQ